MPHSRLPAAARRRLPRHREQHHPPPLPHPHWRPPLPPAAAAAAFPVLPAAAAPAHQVPQLQGGKEGVSGVNQWPAPRQPWCTACRHTMSTLRLPACMKHAACSRQDGTTTGQYSSSASKTNSPTCERALPRLGLGLKHQLPRQHVKSLVRLAVRLVVPVRTEAETGRRMSGVPSAKRKREKNTAQVAVC